MKYTGRMDEDFQQDDCPLLVDVLADLVAEGDQSLGRAILARFRWVYHYNVKWGKSLIRRVNGPTGGRDYLAMFMGHWGKALKMCK